jgi:hypothetical protein
VFRPCDIHGFILFAAFSGKKTANRSARYCPSPYGMESFRCHIVTAGIARSTGLTRVKTLTHSHS